MHSSERVTAVIITKEPRDDWLQQTISSLRRQSVQPSEILVMDSSESPPNLPRDVWVEHVPEVGMGEARRRGIQMAGGDVILHMDEDAVLSSNYIERGLQHLSRPGVSAVGGKVKPVRGNPSGKLISTLDTLNPSNLGTHSLMHYQSVDPKGFESITVWHRGEDITQRRFLSEQGAIVKDGDMLVLKDLPTARQDGALKVVGGLIVGGVVAGLVDNVSGRILDSVLR